MAHFVAGNETEMASLDVHDQHYEDNRHDYPNGDTSTTIPPSGGGSDGTTAAAASADNEDGTDEDMMLIPHGNDESSAKKRVGKTTTISTTTVAVPGGMVGGTGGVETSTKKRLRRKEKQDENATATCIKYAALLMLVGQMVGLVLLMRYSRTHIASGQDLYLASTAVFVMEVMKLVICLGVIAYQTGSEFFSELNLHIIHSPMEIVKLCVPSLLYTIQNNLLYLALTNLDAATYQVCYQLKILTTALFSALLLGRKFSGTKWASLVLLTVGVAVVQISGSNDQHKHPDQDVDQHNRVIGLIAVLCAACTSGFSGVYFERILKNSSTSLWIRNVQMGLPSIIIAYITVFIRDSEVVKDKGFLVGYTSIVWTVVTVQAAGGLIVATVVKYADNVLKVFATSFSIVISCIISAFLFDFHPTLLFMVGASLVVTATVMYSSPERKTRRKSSALPLTHKPRK